MRLPGMQRSWQGAALPGVRMTQGKIKSRIRQCFKDWTARYLKQCSHDKKDNPMADINGSRLLAQNQIFFMKLYVGFMLVPGLIVETLERIEKFLSLQNPVNTKGLMSLHFIGEGAPEVCILTNDPYDVDISDVHAITAFSKIRIFRENNKKWNKKSAMEVFETIKEDMSCDHEDVELEYEYKGKKLEISCNVFWKPVEQARFMAVTHNNVLK